MKKILRSIMCLILAALILAPTTISFSAEETIAYSDVVYSAMDYFKENKDKVIEDMYKCYDLFSKPGAIDEGSVLPKITIEKVEEGYNPDNFTFYCELGGMGDGLPKWFYSPSDKQSILKCVKSYWCTYEQVIGDYLFTNEYLLEEGEEPTVLGGNADNSSKMTLKEKAAAVLGGYADNNYMICRPSLNLAALVFDDNDNVIGFAELEKEKNYVYPYEEIKTAAAGAYERMLELTEEAGEILYGFDLINPDGNITPLPSAGKTQTGSVPTFVYPFFISIILLAVFIGIIFFVYGKKNKKLVV